MVGCDRRELQDSLDHLADKLVRDRVDVVSLSLQNRSYNHSIFSNTYENAARMPLQCASASVKSSTRQSSHLVLSSEFWGNLSWSCDLQRSADSSTFVFPSAWTVSCILVGLYYVCLRNVVFLEFLNSLFPRQ